MISQLKFHLTIVMGSLRLVIRIIVILKVVNLVGSKIVQCSITLL